MAQRLSEKLNAEGRRQLTNNEAAEVIKREKTCVQRQMHSCDRDCAKCDLVLPDSVVLEAYDIALCAIQHASGGD